MSDSGKRSRVQGGWAQQCNRPENQKIKSNDLPIGFKGTSGGLNSTGFKFENVELAKEPTKKVIKSSGDYIISEKPNGQSKIVLKTGFIDIDDCEWIFHQLNDELAWHQHEVKKSGTRYLQPRMTAWIGNVPYSYSGVTHDKFTEWSPLLTMLKDTIESHTGKTFNSVLANLYRDGHDHVPWHSDDEPEFGSHPSIASISFGETRMFQIRRKPFGDDAGATSGELKDSDYMEYIDIPLEAGSLLLMEGAVQLDWQHRIAREYHDKKARINLTFRNITVPHS